MSFYLDSIRSALDELGDGREIDGEVKNLLDNINNQIWDAVHATEEPEYDYEVSLGCVFYEKTPEEAIARFIEWMVEHPYEYVYRVRNLDTDEDRLVDGRDLRV